MKEWRFIKLTKGEKSPTVCWLISILAILLSVETGWAHTQDTVRKSIYPPDMKQKSKLYNKLWGTHYRKVYSIPVSVDAVTLKTLQGGVEVVDQADPFYGIYLKNSQDNLFLMKPLGGATSFLESEFFQEMYNKKDFSGTYMDQFIGDAYTIINPYTFMAADFMARKIGLPTRNSHIYYMEGKVLNDTILDGSSIRNKLVCLIDVPDVYTQKNILSTKDLLRKLHESKSNEVAQPEYIRSRLYDMLVGDWNKVPENWNWIAVHTPDSVRYLPVVIDRNHAFTKVDGLLFKQMLRVLGLGFIINYDESPKDINKLNSLAYALDMAFASGSDESVWLKETRILQDSLTDKTIDDAFQTLPFAVRKVETDPIRQKLKLRRDTLDYIARKYFKLLQKTPVITGTNQADRIVIDRFGSDSLRIRIFVPDHVVPSFDRLYSSEYTGDIWLYGLEGNDRYEVNGVAEKAPTVYLIAGPGDNSYQVESGKHLRIYSYKKDKGRLDSLRHVKKIITDNERVHTYDYKKIKHHDLSFTPWGFYDSDLGISLGAFVTYTKYGFKQSPYTYRHRIGYNYLRGFMYQGMFPFYDERKSFNLDAFIGSPKNFSNFFGFGNETDGFKDEKKNYNRVSLRQYSFTPSFQWDFRKEQRITLSAIFEMYKAKKEENRYITKYYPSDDPIFKMNLYTGLEAAYQYKKSFSSLFSNFQTVLTGGWKMNIKDAGRNFPYADLDISADFNILERFTFATMIRGKAIFNNKYDFFQAAHTELRGYRTSRFVGKQALYQHNDFRFDMGELRNPFTPVKYGFFAGFDYGRVWYPGEHSDKWHTSYGGGLWITFINKFTTKYSCFGSKDTVRFMFALGLGF